MTKEKKTTDRNTKGGLATKATEYDDDLNFKAESSLAAQDLTILANNELSEEEFLKRARTLSSASVLPKPPEIPGFHLLWAPVHSQNISDTVQFKQSLGYVIVKPEEVQNFASQSNRSGQVEGCVSHNELVLMKIPNKYYNMLMKEAHHDQPLLQEQSIKQRIRENMNDNEGKSVIRDEAEMTGINSLARKVPEPQFN